MVISLKKSATTDNTLVALAKSHIRKTQPVFSWARLDLFLALRKEYLLIKMSFDSSR